MCFRYCVFLTSSSTTQILCFPLLTCCLLSQALPVAASLWSLCFLPKQNSFQNWWIAPKMQGASGSRQELFVLQGYNLSFCGYSFTAKRRWEDCERQSAEHTEEQWSPAKEVAATNRNGKNCDSESWLIFVSGHCNFILPFLLGIILFLIPLPTCLFLSFHLYLLIHEEELVLAETVISSSL